MPITPHDLDRLLAPTYLDNIGEVSLDDLRRMRTECQEAEVSASFVRRLIQGRMDVVHAFIERPAGSPAPDLSSVVDKLAGIIAGPGGSRGAGRNPVLHSPDTDDMAEMTTELDAILGPDDIGRLADLDEAQLGDLADRLRALENRVSGERKGLFDRIDALQAELVERYKSGRATADGLLA